MTDIRVAKRGKIDLLNFSPGNNFTIPADPDIIIASRDVQVEFLICKCCGNISPLRAGNTINEPVP
jgi:hypothetical protein